jgi:hypothetical protein
VAKPVAAKLGAQSTLAVRRAESPRMRFFVVFMDVMVFMAVMAFMVC